MTQSDPQILAQNRLAAAKLALLASHESNPDLLVLLRLARAAILAAGVENRASERALSPLSPFR